MKAPDAFARAAAEVISGFGVDHRFGLSAAEAAARRERFGANELVRKEGPSPLEMLWRQLNGVVQYVLFAAAGLAWVLGELLDAFAILAILVLNSLLGFVQERKAGKALAALARMTSPQARVRRDGKSERVDAAQVVPGDVLLLEAGDVVAADARLLAADELVAVEAALTGESTPVSKDAGVVLEVSTPLADRRNMVFAGTHIGAGAGLAIVTATGMETELGHIAGMLAETGDERTPLQRRLDQVGRQLLLICLGVVGVVFGIGLLRGEPWGEQALAAVSLAVASIPEGLPAVVTIALALGVQAMARRGALVRRLPSVETLGSASVICTDKTGTLTTGTMAVRELVPAHGTSHDELAYALAACNDAELNEKGGIGDPTEVALLVAARDHGVLRSQVEQQAPRVATEPFSSRTRRMVVVRAHPQGEVAWLKGAPEVVASLVQEPRDIEERALALAKRGLRVLAFARGEGGGPYQLLGLAGLADPPRKEAGAAVDRCRRAGIVPVMVTGDHPATALAIARELGLADSDRQLCSGSDLADLSDDALAAHAADIRVFARVTAADKLRIVRALQRRGHVVAMTGDGVNDAPALKEADIGVAMGRTGTEVTKEAADLVLTDDNFATIVGAVELGRAIFANIRKVLRYLLTANSAEIALMLGAALVGLPLPLTPVQLLWINLVTDGLPALALVTDPADAGLLSQPPRPRQAPMMDRAFVRRLVWGALWLTGVSLGGYAWFLTNHDVGSARTVVFDIMVYGQLLLTLALRSDERLLWQVGVLSNTKLLLAVVLTFGLQALLHVLPWGRAVFNVGAWQLEPQLLSLALALVPVSALELGKLVHR